MGVLLTPIAVKETIGLESLRGRRLALDGNGELYQFLALIRQRDGTLLDRMLGALGITREQLVDLALLVGTDFNEAIKGIGPKKALALVKRHGSIEAMPAEVREGMESIAGPVRRLYLDPDVTDDYQVQPDRCDGSGVVRFLCDERVFSEQRVRAAMLRAFPEAS